MLRIARLSRKARGLTIKLEGEILEPWVAAVRNACAECGWSHDRVELDLAAITYVDAAGRQLLCELLRNNVEITAGSSFFSELLELDHSSTAFRINSLLKSRGDSP